MTFRRLGDANQSRRVVTFKFDGKAYSGLEGETLVAALLANGQTVLGRSFKYHRPRGPFAPGNAEPNALVTLVRAEFCEPNIKASEIEIFDGLVALSQNRFPSLKYDLGAINALGGKLLSAGFYYKTFMGPSFGPLRSTAFWMFCEKFIRRAAGLGRAGLVADPDRYERVNAFCDVLIVGAGAAGRAAAAALHAAGLRVIIADQNAPDLEPVSGVRHLSRTHVWGLYDGNTYAATEKVADHKPTRALGEPRQRYWVIRCKTAIHACGAIERQIVFPGNDRPGIMLTSLLDELNTKYNIVPAAPVAFFVNNDAAYFTIHALVKNGVTIAAIIDVRTEISDNSRLVGINSGAVHLLGSAVVDTAGRQGLRSITVQNHDPATGVLSGIRQTIPCQVLGLSGGWSPAIQLASQAGEKSEWDERLQAFLAPAPAPGFRFYSCGSAAGIFGNEPATEDGTRIAKKIIAAMHGTRISNAPAPIGDPDFACAPVHQISVGGVASKTFVDLQHDVTVDDIKLAHLEGFSSSEHMKRYTTLGMATDQGRNSAIPALHILGSAQGKSIAQTGTTRFRAPASGVAFGVLAAERFGDLQPYRQTPIHDWHVENGAVLYAAGLWHRPMIYSQGTETIEQSYVREARAVRMGVGIADVSTLGKIDIQGPDARIFLDRIYTNMFSNLAVGKARYGLMLREDGIVMDDGTTWRLGPTHYLMTTTTANAGKVMQHLDYYLGCIWPDLKVHITSVTDQWGGAAISGPLSRKVLESCVKGTALDTIALPFMGLTHGQISGIPVMICRLSFSGELAFEVYCGAGHSQIVWNAIMQSGKPFNIVPYGLEALGTLRIEKGHVTGAEIDGRTTAHDLHLGWMLSKKKAFVGQAMMNRAGLTHENRLTLVGLICKSGNPISGGSHVVLNTKMREPTESFGHVTAACYSPALEKYIALALVKNGNSRIGTMAYATSPLRGEHLSVDIVSHHMFDPEGRRMHV